MRNSSKTDDSIMEEVRAVRDSLAIRCGYDVERIAQLIKADEKKSGAKLVNRPPKRPAKKRIAS